MAKRTSGKQPSQAERGAAKKSTKGGEKVTRAARLTRDDIRKTTHRVPTIRPQREER